MKGRARLLAALACDQNQLNLGPHLADAMCCPCGRCRLVGALQRLIATDVAAAALRATRDA